MLEGAARGLVGKRIVGMWRSRVTLTNFGTRKLSRLKYKLVCYFKLVADMVGVASGSLCMTGWTDSLFRNAGPSCNTQTP